MSAQCNHFVQNAWKKELCANCFKSKEEHVNSISNIKTVISRTPDNVKHVTHKLQGILRLKDKNSQVKSKRKNVAFPEALTEIIGNDGGDDSTEEYSDDYDQNDSIGTDDDVPDNEEDRALGNLTRANTNFNTITANLSEKKDQDSNKSAAKTFASLKLGTIQKDADGNKKTLLISVTPFGADDSIPTAKRPISKKIIDTSKTNNTSTITIDSQSKNEVQSRDAVKNNENVKSTLSKLGKIVDMPLITSTNIVSPVSTDSLKNDINVERKINITRAPAMKKIESEKPKLLTQNSKGVELNLNPINAGIKHEISGIFSARRVTSLDEREVEGEATTNIFKFDESRESVGEPDGKADEEIVTEPPALPKSPPPTVDPPVFRDSKLTPAEPRTSFLHGESKSKPCIPQKPISLPIKPMLGPVGNVIKNSKNHSDNINQSNMSSFQDASSFNSSNNLKNSMDSKISRFTQAYSQSENQLYPKSNNIRLNQSDSMESKESEKSNKSSDQERIESVSNEQPSLNKRRMAPMPPNSSNLATEESPTNLFTRNPTVVTNTDCPVVREKEKRERASSCSPKFRQTVSNSPDPCGLPNRAPEPAPRRNISMSQDSLAGSLSLSSVVDEKKKMRSKFSIKKFLRMGSRKEIDMTCASLGAKIDKLPVTPQPRPRIEIIHPLELDGAAVQVVKNEKTNEDTTNSKIEQINLRNQILQGAQNSSMRSKPPPPPRSNSLQEDPAKINPVNKENQLNSRNSPGNIDKPVGKSWQPNGSSTSDSIYANLAAEDVAGTNRSILAPVKPRRTSSLRDQTTSQETVKTSTQQHGLDQTQIQETTDVSDADGFMQDQQNDRDESQTEESLSSMSEYETSLELRPGKSNYPALKRQSDSGALNSKTDLRFQQFFTRSSSLPYCAGESDNLYSTDEVFITETNDLKKGTDYRTGRLRHCRGRSIVHSSLEDNYGAVVVANHEALAQFLDQLNQNQVIAAGFRALKTSNLQLSDFIIDKNTAVLIGRRIFYSAVWNEQNVTISISFEQSIHVSKNEFYLEPIIEFVDTLPKDILDQTNYPGRKTSQATISVLPRLQIKTIKSFAADILETKEDNAMRESSFMLLQLVSALKSLQARGNEEAPKNLTNVVLCREEKDAYHRLYLLQSVNMDSCENNEEEYVSLCQCALTALEELKLKIKLPLIRDLLVKEKSDTLSQVKSILEYSLWGPADATLGGPRERESALQRWLDLERATVLHALVKTHTPLTVTDKYQLLFLVRTSAKIMCEASLHLDKQRNGILRTF